MNVLDALFGAFAAPFLLRPLLVLGVVAVAAAVLGTLIHVRKLEFTTDAITHAVFPGLAIGIAIGGDDALVPGALVAATVAAGLLVLLSGRGVSEDATLAVILTSCFSVGVIVVSRSTAWTGGLTQLLFGKLLTVGWDQVLVSTIVIAAVVTVAGLWWRSFIARAFDVRAARAQGVPVRALDLVLAIGVSWVVVIAVWSIGTLLAVAVLVIPAAVGRLVRESTGQIALVAFGFALVASWLGLVIANWVSVDANLNLPPGATVALTFVAGYLIALVATSAIRFTRRSVHV